MSCSVKPVKQEIVAHQAQKPGQGWVPGYGHQAQVLMHPGVCSDLKSLEKDRIESEHHEARWHGDDAVVDRDVRHAKPPSQQRIDEEKDEKKRNNLG